MAQMTLERAVGDFRAAWLAFVDAVVEVLEFDRIMTRLDRTLKERDAMMAPEHRIENLKRARKLYTEQAERHRAAGQKDLARKAEKAATRTRDRIRELGGTDDE